jgi:type VI secretion system protein ImpG
MSEALYPYYTRELVFIRQLAQEFAKQYPAIANRLLLEENGQSTDPHVERLIQSFALLAGRIHHKLDDEFPELTDAVLGVLYPHYLAPVPSLAIIQFELDPGQAQLPDGFLIKKGTPLHTHPVGDLPCRFRTGYPVTLWPVELTSARLAPPPAVVVSRRREKAAVLRLEFACLADMSFAELSLERLRFFLTGESQQVANLYEILLNHTIQVVFRSLDAGPRLEPIVLAPEKCLGQVGFEPDEALLPYPPQSFPGYRLLTEFFAYPARFQFVDLGGWRQAARAKFGRKAEVLLFLNRTMTSLEQGVEAATFRLGCAPVINLFEKTAEPVRLTHTRSEYPVIPDVAYPTGMEVFSVDSVTSANPVAGTSTEYQPFYSFRHGRQPEQQRAFWYATRRHSPLKDDRGTDVYLRLVDLNFNPRLPADSVLVIRTICTNRDLPNLLQRAGEGLYFELESAAPLTRIHCLRSPTRPLRPPLRRGAQWGLVSHLCLNHLSIAESAEGLAALQEILKLYDFSDPEAGQNLSEVNRQLIEGILAVQSRRVVGRTGTGTAAGFCRGVEITVELDEQKYVGTGAFLFACVLERFLGLYTSINSFSQLIARTKQGGEYLKKWPPRAGEQPLL